MPIRSQYPRFTLRLTGVFILLAFVASTVNAQPVGAGSGQPFVNHRFMVEVAGMEQLSGFFSVDGLDWQTEVITYVEGNELAETKLPGRTTYSNITLRRGYTGADVLWDWYEGVINGNVQQRSGSIIILDAANHEIKRYNFFDAWPSRYSIHDLNSLERGILVEEIELVVRKVEPA